jgi:uncharacterized protein involved in exopolysaccharide biosynthesis
MPNPGTDAHSEADNGEEVVLDLGLLSAIIRRHKARLLGLVVFWSLLCALIMLFVVPQSYTSTVSIALQQSSTALPSLSNLFGGSSPAARYMGVLRSQRLAKEVEQTVHLQQLFGLSSKQDAIEKLQKAQQVENSTTDGLLYLHVSLNGPPRLLPGSTDRRHEIQRATVLAANAYGVALRRYMLYSDTDRDAVLLREADKKLRTARTDYDHAVDQLIEFVRHSPTAATTASTDTTSSAGSTSEAGSAGVNTALAQLQQLFVRRGQLEVSIKSAEAGKSAVGNLLEQPTQDLAQMPTEDPLLADARQQVSDAQVTLKNLLAQYAEGNPRVVLAQERLRIANQHLQDQVNALKAGRSTDQVKLDRLRAEYEDVQQQLTKAEKDFAVSRNLTSQYERLHSEVQIRLEVLKTVFTRYSELSLQTVATQNRMLIVDPAELPRQGSPSMTVMAIMSVLAGLLLTSFNVFREFARERRAV